MKILVDRTNEGVDDHARDVVAHLTKMSRKPSVHDVRPIGIAHYRAQFPIECEECGLTFWARDPFASHRGCKGEQKGTGFA